MVMKLPLINWSRCVIREERGKGRRRGVLVCVAMAIGDEVMKLVPLINWSRCVIREPRGEKRSSHK